MNYANKRLQGFISLVVAVTAVLTFYFQFVHNNYDSNNTNTTNSNLYKEGNGNINQYIETKGNKNIRTVVIGDGDVSQTIK